MHPLSRTPSVHGPTFTVQSLVTLKMTRCGVSASECTFQCWFSAQDYDGECIATVAVTVNHESSLIASGEADSFGKVRLSFAVPCEYRSFLLRRTCTVDLSGFAATFSSPGYETTTLPLWQVAPRRCFRAWWPWQPRPRLSLGCGLRPEK